MSTRDRVPGRGIQQTYSQQKPLTDAEQLAQWNENRARHAVVMRDTNALLARLGTAYPEREKVLRQVDPVLLQAACK